MRAGRALPSVRAVTLFARTIFRELKRADYTKAEILAFVNDLLDLLTMDTTSGPLDGVNDPETQLANVDVLLEALDLEIRRARERGTSVLLLGLELVVPSTTPDDVAHQIHRELSHRLERGVRPGDTVARVQGQYVIILPSAPQESASPIAQRLAQPLFASRRADDRLPEGTAVRHRSAHLDLKSAGASGQEILPDAPAALLAKLFEDPGSDLVWERIGRAAHASPTPPPPPPVPSPSSSDDLVVALGGGAARAAAHIGVFRALRDQGIRIAGISGASGGALVGAMALLGMDDATMLERFVSFPKTTTHLRMRRQYAAFRRAGAVPRTALRYFRESGIGLLSNTALAAISDDVYAEFIEHFVGRDRDIAQLGAPFAAVATDLVQGRALTLTSGPLHTVLRASCAMPGLFPPQVLENRLLVDGATISEVPVKAALALGKALPVLAIHLARPEHIVPGIQSSVEALTRANAVVHQELVREQLRHASSLITVPVDDIGWLDFGNAAHVADAGYRAARAYLARRRTRGPS